jgi:hypothetical protein
VRKGQGSWVASWNWCIINVRYKDLTRIIASEE